MGILTDQVSWYRYRDDGEASMGQGATLEWSLEGYEPIWDVVAFGDAQGTQGDESTIPYGAGPPANSKPDPDAGERTKKIQVDGGYPYVEIHDDPLFVGGKGTAKLVLVGFDEGAALPAVQGWYVRKVAGAENHGALEIVRIEGGHNHGGATQVPLKGINAGTDEVIAALMPPTSSQGSGTGTTGEKGGVVKSGARSPGPTVPALVGCAIVGAEATVTGFAVRWVDICMPVRWRRQPWQSPLRTQDPLRIKLKLTQPLTDLDAFFRVYPEVRVYTCLEWMADKNDNKKWLPQDRHNWPPITRDNLREWETKKQASWKFEPSLKQLRIELTNKLLQSWGIAGLGKNQRDEHCSITNLPKQTDPVVDAFDKGVVALSPLAPKRVIARREGRWPSEGAGVGSNPPWSAEAGRDYAVLGGAVYLAVCCGQGENEKRDVGMIQDTADWLCLNAHGGSTPPERGGYPTGSVYLADGWLRPADVAKEWCRDVDVAMFISCGVLDVDDIYGLLDDDGEDGPEPGLADSRRVTPGRRWAKTGVPVLLGYVAQNWTYPPVIRDFLKLTAKGKGTREETCKAWVEANWKHRKVIQALTNAVAIHTAKGKHTLYYGVLKHSLSVNVTVLEWSFR